MALMPSTKDQIKSFVHKTVTELKDGYSNPLSYYIQLKAVETTIKDLLANKEVREMVSTEAKKYGKSFDLHGVKIEYSENISPKYDYSVCGDIAWDEMQTELKALQEKIKLREAFLKAIPENSRFNNAWTTRKSGAKRIKKPKKKYFNFTFLNS